MPTLSWYWHRVRAMSPSEMALHARKAIRQASDIRREWTPPALGLEPIGGFPKLPRPEDAPLQLRETLERDLDAILAGRWKVFDGLELTVDDPPRWHCDYTVMVDLDTRKPAFKLDYRKLPKGGDIKLIWEISRWSQLVRLGMAAHVLDSQLARDKCTEWLEDWVEHNPPYHGWNWTSALEAGIRLIQFTWLDALLSGPPRPNRGAVAATDEQRLVRLRKAILPAHLRFVWRYRSFGSSANNHLLGELTGCILAMVRWPDLQGTVTTLDHLQECWEQEVLKQFAPDGGNREQALNYHLFSFELCWQSLKALEWAHREVARPVRERLGLAAAFYRKVQVPSDPWDYGDSDGAYVTPFFVENPVQEWHQWMSEQGGGTGVGYWLGGISPRNQQRARDMGSWRLFPDSGMAVCDAPPWRLRWDLSPLGYLRTAAHGHSDALHVSVWYQGVGLVIDPGTGAYYAHEELRRWLASGGAHNGPRPMTAEEPTRLGPFLWGSHHPIPSLTVDESGALGVLNLPGALVRRRISRVSVKSGWQVEDGCLDRNGRPQPFTVLWQFAPETQVQMSGEGSVPRAATRGGGRCDCNWSVDSSGVDRSRGGCRRILRGWASRAPLAGVVSPGFRRVCRGPLLKLARTRIRDGTATFRTAFCEADR